MTFERLSFNTSIHYEVRPSCLSLNRMRETVDDYCDWGNETAYVPAGFTNCVQLRKNTASQDCLDWIKRALKIASYFTLIIPALMYLAKYLLRSSPFYIIPQAQQSSSAQTHSQAATRIQRAFRHHRARKEQRQRQETVKTLHLQNETATRLQKVCRGYLARKDYQQQQAIVTIQNFWRCHLARAQVEEARDYTLPGKLFDAALPYLEGWQDVEKARVGGGAQIYFIPSAPVLLKFSIAGRRRIYDMNACRAVCRENKFQHIVIPKVYWHDPYLVESRIFFSSDTKQSICLYVLNLKKFTQVAIEFTRLLCQANLVDITDKNDYCCFTDVDIPMPRYDNVAVFLEEEGKIGLVDLEYFEKYGHYINVYKAVYFFPFHIKEIYKTAKLAYPEISKHKEKLLKIAKKQANGFNRICTDHFDLLKKKDVTIEKGAILAPFSQSTKTELVKRLGGFLIEIHEEGIRFDNLLGKQPEQTAATFSKEFAEPMLDAIHEVIQRNITFNYKNEVNSLPQLLVARTVKLKWYRVRLDVLTNLYKRMALFTDIPALQDEDEAAGLFLNLVDKICNVLVEQGEFAFYKHNFGRGAGDSLIFC